MGVQFFVENHDFAMWQTQHIVVLVFSFLLGGGLIGFAKKSLNPVQQHKTGIALSLFISLSVLVWTGLRLYLGHFDIKEDLPFYLCDFVAVTLPLFMIYRNKLVYEIIYFWILAGTLQAILFPDLKNGFPHYHFLKFWIVHVGLVIAILYATIVFKMRPTFKSIWKSYFALQPYFIFSLLLNVALDANYNYLSFKPPGGSLLDFFGPWPWYILVGQIVTFPLFVLVYSPFFFKKSKNVSS